MSSYAITTVNNHDDVVRYREQYQDWKMVGNGDPYAPLPLAEELTTSRSWGLWVPVGEEGRIVSRQYCGRVWALVDRFEREYGLVERIFRVALGALLSIATLGLALISQTVRGFFGDKKTVVITGYLLEDLEPGKTWAGELIRAIKTFKVVEKMPSSEEGESGIGHYLCEITFENSDPLLETAESCALPIEEDVGEEKPKAVLKRYDAVEIRDLLTSIPKGGFQGDLDLFTKAEYPWPTHLQPAEPRIDNSFDNSFDGEGDESVPGMEASELVDVNATTEDEEPSDEN